MIAGNDGQAYFSKFIKKVSGLPPGINKSYMERRAKEDPFSISGYIKNQLSRGYFEADLYSLERISGNLTR